MSDVVFWCLLGFAGAVACFLLAAACLACWIALELWLDEDQRERQARHAEWIESQEGEVNND